MSTNGPGISAEGEQNVGSTNGPGISAEGKQNVGGYIGIESDRLKDVAPSFSDPHDELLMPHLPTPAWQVLVDGSAKESEALNALKAVMAWKAAGCLRHVYELKLWPGENPSDLMTLPTAFPLARQSSTNLPEIQDRINRLELWTFDLLTQSRETILQMLRAGDVELWKDSRTAVLRRVATKPESEVAKDLEENRLTAQQGLRTHGYLEARWSETKGMIDASARWGLYLGRYFFDEKFQSLTKDTRFDLSQPWWRPQHQGRTAGCVGYAVADLLRNQLNDERILPSARYLWNGAKEFDGESRPTTFVARAGTSLRGALKLVKDVGCALESELPSDSLEPFPGSLAEFYQHVPNRKVAAVVNLGMDKKMWLSWLALGRPVSCAIRMNPEFASLGPNKVRLENFDPADPRLVNHAVVIAGWRLAPETFQSSSSYDLVEGALRSDRKAPADQTTYFPVEYLVRNSLGEGWGAGGYAWVPHRLMRLMAREAYGVLLGHDEVKNPGAAPAKRFWADTAGPANTATLAS